MDYKSGLLIYYLLTINRNDLVLSRDPIHHVIWLLLTSLISECMAATIHYFFLLVGQHASRSKIWGQRVV